MAEKRRYIDVWLVESNTVYREVPFTVVADWVQQGRLVADDMIRPSGTRDWFKIGENPTFSAYLPRVEANRVEDQAEALEAVNMDFAWKRSPEDEDDDVDMIPLIDISLVLLVFFILTQAISAMQEFENVPKRTQEAMQNIPAPEVVNAVPSGERDVTIFIYTSRGKTLYTIARPDVAIQKEDEGLEDLDRLEERLRLNLRDLKKRLAEKTGKVEPMDVAIKADRKLPAIVIRQVKIRLDYLKQEDLVGRVLDVVSPKAKS